MFEFIEDEGLKVKVKEAVDNLIQTNVKEQVEAAVLGLKSKNDELLAEKKKIQERLAQFSDIDDPEKAKEALNFIKQSTEAQMIKDGRIDELIQMKTATFRADMEAQINDLKKQVDETGKQAGDYQSRYERKIVEDHLRAVAKKNGVLDSAIEDILMRGSRVFSLNNANNEVEARDHEGKLVKDKKDDTILTSEKWVLNLREVAPHYWPPSKGGGFGGPGSGNNDDLQARLADLASRGKMDEYKELRKKMKQA